MAQWDAWFKISRCGVIPGDDATDRVAMLVSDLGMCSALADGDLPA